MDNNNFALIQIKNIAIACCLLFFVKVSAQTTTVSLNEEITIEEGETDFEKTNDTPQTAIFIENLNSNNITGKATINGSFNIAAVPETPIRDLGMLEEAPNFDNGTISTATDLNLPETSEIITGTGFIGDGANSFAQTGFGDHDYYAISLKEGQMLDIEVIADDEENLINPNIFIIHPNDPLFLGVPLSAFSSFVVAETVGNANIASLKFVAPEDGIYYLTIGAYSVELPSTPFSPVPNSTLSFFLNPENPELREPSLNEGPYSFNITFISNEPLNDIDHYSIDVKKGDVIAMGIEGPIEEVKLFGPANEFLIGHDGFATIAFAADSPLPKRRGVDMYLSYIATETGKYTFSYTSAIVGAYNAEVVVSRPGSEINKGQKQIVYLDFTGAEYTESQFLEGFDNFTEEELKIRNLSPLSAYMENWGFENTKRNRTHLAYKITQVVKENFKDILVSNVNPNSNIIIISDFGSTFLGNTIPKFLESCQIPYSRLIVGGSKEEAGINTIGRATIVDVGNYSLDDLAFVLLDGLSEPLDSLQDANDSINSVPIAEGESKENLVATIVGNIASHEIGHFLGNYHTSINDVPSLMDTGSNLFRNAGIPPGGKFGDENNFDLDFVEDEHDPAVALDFIEGSKNNTINNTAWGLDFMPFNGYRLNSNNTNFEIEEQLKSFEKEVISELNYIINTPNIYNYPNPVPADGITTLYLSAKQSGKATINLWSLKGQNLGLIFEGTVQQNETTEIQLNTRSFNLLAGMYFYTVNMHNQIYNYKLIIK